MAGLSDSKDALVKSTLIGTVLQVAMVVAGHYMPSIQQYFPIGGGINSAIAGLLFARMGGVGTAGLAAGGGAIAGGACAFLGILVSHFLGDVAAGVLAYGTTSSTLAGVIGGVLGKFLTKSSPA